MLCSPLTSEMYLSCGIFLAVAWTISITYVETVWTILASPAHRLCFGGAGTSEFYDESNLP